MPASVSSDRSSSPERLLISGAPTPRTASPEPGRKGDPSKQAYVTSDEDEDEDGFAHVRASAPDAPRTGPAANGLQSPNGQRSVPSRGAASEANNAAAPTPANRPAVAGTEAPAAGASSAPAGAARSAGAAPVGNAVVLATPQAPKSKLEQLFDGVYSATLAVFAAIVAVVTYVVQVLRSGWNWGRATASTALAAAKTKFQRAKDSVRRWSSAGLRRVQAYAAPEVALPASRYAKAKAWVKTKVRNGCGYLLNKLNGRPAAQPTAPAPRPAATPRAVVSAS